MSGSIASVFTLEVVVQEMFESYDKIDTLNTFI